MPSLVELPDLAATEAFGRRLGAALFPGAVVALIGPLGAGKTHLVAAIAEGLGIRDRRLVASPTFGLIHEYSARLPIYHFDVYRLKSLVEFQDLGAHEYFEGQGVCLIEWADKVESCLPEEYLRIEIAIMGETSRRLHLSASSDRYAALIARES
jgi:tRNA threonylcarbamoyladenosine biosynthesis protein TsaE